VAQAVPLSRADYTDPAEKIAHATIEPAGGAATIYKRLAGMPAEAVCAAGRAAPLVSSVTSLLARKSVYQSY